MPHLPLKRPCIKPHQPLPMQGLNIICPPGMHEIVLRASLQISQPQLAQTHEVTARMLDLQASDKRGVHKIREEVLHVSIGQRVLGGRGCILSCCVCPALCWLSCCRNHYCYAGFSVGQDYRECVAYRCCCRL